MALALTQKRELQRATASRARWAFVACLCLLLAGCSATRIVYNQLDWLIVWYVSDFFTLDDAQEERLEQLVRKNVDWHRRDQLPKYAQLVREIDRDATTGAVTLSAIDRHYGRMIELWDEFIVKTIPDVSEFFLLLGTEQVDEFIANLEESNQELWEEYAGQTAEERRENRHKSTIRGIERLFGRLSRDQKDLVRLYQDGLHDVSLEWMAGRRQWQQEFRDLVVERPPEPEFSERMARLMLMPNENDRAEYRMLVEENRLLMMRMIVALDAELTDKQRKKFSHRMKKLARNIEILAAPQT